MERAFPYLALGALVTAVVQVTLGGVVRVTGSGLGCPDWPLCDGRVIPVYERSALVEFSHRVVASVVGLLTVSVAIIAVRRFRTELSVLLPSLLGAFLVLIAALLGAIVVWTELSWWVRLIHLGLAEGVVACLVIVALVGRRTADPKVRPTLPVDGRLGMFIVASLAGVFVLVLSGSYMVGYGAGSSCGTWPLCRGSLLPEGTAYAVHMSHRLLAGAVGLLVIATAIAAIRRAVHIPGLSVNGWTVIALLVGQTAVGAGTVWAGFSVETRAAHLGGATLLWAAIVGLATLYFVRQGSPFHRVARTHRLAPPEGAAP